MTDTLDELIPAFGPLDAAEPAEQFDWFSAKAAAQGALAVDADLEADIALTAKRTKMLLANHLRGHKALNEALACVYQFAERNRHHPAKIIAALRNAGLPVTRATLSSPYLPFIRLFFSATTGALQSRYASGLAYLAAEGCPAEGDAAKEIARRGGIEACARAFAQNRKTKHPPAKSRELDLLRTGQPTIAIEGPLAALVPSDPGIGVVIVERRSGGDLVAYAHVGDAATVARAIKSWGK